LRQLLLEAEALLEVEGHAGRDTWSRKVRKAPVKGGNIGSYMQRIRCGTSFASGIVPEGQLVTRTAPTIGVSMRVQPPSTKSGPR
jgi:hypothetical protein